ncbi:MAG: DUF3054 domain-containing protein [Actinomycetes bacterium]
MRAGIALVIDAALVLLFAALGRSAHHEAEGFLGVLATAWPFLVGVGLAWLGTWAWRGRRPTSLAVGIPAWLSAVVVGMLLRRSVGEGTALSFVLVATVVLGLFLVGWRVLWLLAARASRRR